jgi:phage I-like protein
MLPISTRAGGDSAEMPQGLLRFDSTETAGAPAFLAGASSTAQWVELLKLGAFRGRDGRGPYRLDDPDAVIQASNAARMTAGIPIDYDHAIDLAAPGGAPAPAAGWIKELAVRDSAIWGRVEWTSRAASAIASHEYRYISPVFQYSPADGHVIRLLRAGLTNNPNLYLTAISAAGSEDTMDDFCEPGARDARAHR